MFSSDPLKNVGYRIIYLSVVIHGLCLVGQTGGSPARHIGGILGALLWSLWMIYGSSKLPWIMNILGTAVGAITSVVIGIGGLSKSIVSGLTMIIIGLVFADLCRRLCTREVSSNYI
jgi:predicted membrane protein